MQQSDPFLTIAEAATDKRVSRSILDTARQFGTLVVVRFDNGRLRIRQSELDRWAAERARAEAEWREGIEQRRQERQMRRERWLACVAARHGLVPATGREVAV